MKVDDVTHPRRIELLLRDVTEVFEKLLPTFAEEPRFVPAAPREVMRSAEGSECRVTLSYQFSWIFSRSRVSQFLLMILRKSLKSWITS